MKREDNESLSKYVGLYSSVIKSCDDPCYKIPPVHGIQTTQTPADK